MTTTGVKLNMANPFHASLKASFHAYRDDLTYEGEDAATSLAGCWDKGRDWLYALLRGEIRFPVTMLPEWIRVTGDYTPLEWICEQVGVVMVRVIPGTTSAGPAAVMVCELGELMKRTAESEADGQIDAEELHDIDALTDRVVAAVYAHRERVRRMAAQGERVTRLADAG